MKEEKPDEHNLLSELCGGECVWVQGGPGDPAALLSGTEHHRAFH